MRVHPDLELGPNSGNIGRYGHFELHLACCHAFLHQRYIPVYEILDSLSAHCKHIYFSCGAILCALSCCSRGFSRLSESAPCCEPCLGVMDSSDWLPAGGAFC